MKSVCSAPASDPVESQCSADHNLKATAVNTCHYRVPLTSTYFRHHDYVKKCKRISLFIHELPAYLSQHTNRATGWTG